MKIEKVDSAKEKLAAIWQKTTDISKKAVDDVQKKAKEIAEDTKKTIQEQQLKKYTPVTLKGIKSKKFNIPSIIEIVDDGVKKDLITKDDAIGWVDAVKEVAVLHLYSSNVNKTGLTFLPNVKSNAVYCADCFDGTRFIDSENIFEKSTEEKLAELENIAYLLGAKSCSIEVTEYVAEKQSASLLMAATVKNASVNVDSGSFLGKRNMQSGKTVTHFEGNNIPQRPTLKWFRNDNNILGLIEMRCSNNNSIKFKKMEIIGSSVATMTKKIACSIDALCGFRGGVSMEKQAVKEHNSKLVFEVEF